MSDHELTLGRGATYATDPDLSPAARMAAIAVAYAVASGGGAGDRVPAGSPATPPPARDLHDLLERAALEGRQPRPPDDGTGHDPEPPALRCQRCGLPIAIVVVTGITDDWDRFAWTHVLGGDDGHE